MANEDAPDTDADDWHPHLNEHAAHLVDILSGYRVAGLPEPLRDRFR